MKRVPLHTRILIGMGVGLVVGSLGIAFQLGGFITDWIKPLGTIFINLLKLIAIPLILASLVSGVSNLRDISKLSRIGGKTLSLYLITTVLAITVGLVAVNTIKPGNFLSREKQLELSQRYASDASLRVTDAQKLKESGPLQVVVDIVPDNIFGAASANRNMLQVIFFAVLFGIALLMTPEEKGLPVKNFFDGINEVILKLVDMVMRYAPIGVMALLAALMTDVAGDNPKQALELFSALGVYAFTVLLSLALMVLLIYPLAIRMFTHLKYKEFLKAILPAQIMAFTTSSSAATLPVTMECAEKNLKIKDEINSFVLPLGATINMDGTSIHQAVSAVFIAQAFGHDLTLADQLVIILTATLSSIGAAAVPSAGLITLVIVLGAIGVSPEGLALIIAIDRPLDMCRTIVNVTGDTVVASIVATTENGFQKPDGAN
ncbi:MAG: dicarboxylate/amino acid:cation symporter [Cyclobacteriaceae bacterium]|nr:dicarboxylate/amino acid:cation symporter [Cyclobacteriaceae bacterium]MCX7637289.1 dicarboxylate/amino acid:cation symporter [Cyclobacteriaceae bacterium]MDW8331254.1 dicarboxylate/amino acid:cation symporter [Cyclobacteriaceae bacterium]